MESIYGEENADKTAESIAADCDIEFGWFAPSAGAFNHIVKDWHPQYNGSILMALATTLNSGKDKYYTMNDDGDIEEVESLGAARLGINSNDKNKKLSSTIQEYSNWSFVTQYPYKANMTIIGAPCEVPMTGKIKVTARIGNEIHHSSGVYMVLGKVDKISSAGFFTELELFKFAPGFDPKYAIGNNNNDDDEEDENNEETENEKLEKEFNEKDKNKDGKLDYDDDLGPINSVTKEEYKAMHTPGINRFSYVLTNSATEDENKSIHDFKTNVFN
jgi:hypothetical protein